MSHHQALQFQKRDGSIGDIIIVIVDAAIQFVNVTLSI